MRYDSVIATLRIGGNDKRDRVVPLKTISGLGVVGAGLLQNSLRR